MAGFQIGVTDAGMELLGKGLAGGEICFTGIQMGDGVFNGNIAAATALVSPKATLPISRLIRKSAQVTLKGVLKFGAVPTGFTWREVGLLAKDPDSGAEVLYAYGVSSSQGDYIPGAAEATLDERTIQLTVLVAGTEQVTALLDPSAVYVENSEFEEAVAALRAGSVQTLVHEKAEGVHQLSGLAGRSGLISGQFLAASGYEQGDSFSLDGESYLAQSQDGSELADGAFVQGAAVAVLIDTVGKTINFKPAGGGKSPFPAGTYALCQAFRQSGSWTAPFSGKYRFICIGRGGAGALSRYTSGQSQPATSGGGGGSGGWCEKTLELEAGAVFTMQVVVAYSRILSGSEVVMTASRGTNGTGGYNGNVGAGGTGGPATGGDQNHSGLNGQPGAQAADGEAAAGGDGAPMSDWEQLPLYLNASHGVGGLSGSNSSPEGIMASAPELFGLSLGAGGGGGGITADRTAGEGASGSVGCIIVEYVLG